MKRNAMAFNEFHQWINGGGTIGRVDDVTHKYEYLHIQSLCSHKYTILITYKCIGRHNSHLPQTHPSVYCILNTYILLHNWKEQTNKNTQYCRCWGWMTNSILIYNWTNLAKFKIFWITQTHSMANRATNRHRVKQSTLRKRTTET